MNNKQNISKVILRNAGRSEDLSAVLRTAKDCMSNGEITQFEKAMFEAVLLAESVALSVRDLVYSSISNKLQVFESKNTVASDTYNVSIACENGVLKVTLPMLCPHKNATPRRLLMLEPIITAFKNYEKTNTLPQYKDAVLMFRNVINPHIYKNFPRDNSNYEYAKVQNIIVSHVMADDDYMSCKLFADTAFGNKTYTEIYVIPTEKFGLWYQNNLPNLTK